MSDVCRPLISGSRKFNILQSEKFSIEIIWEPLRPFRPFIFDVSIKNRLEGNAVAYILITRSLIDEGDYANMRQTSHQNFRLLGLVELLNLEGACLPRSEPNITYSRQ